MKTKNKILSLNEDFDSIFKSIANGITGVWVWVTLTIFPLYTHDMYFDILGARYNFYKISIIVQVALLLLLLLVYILIDGKERNFSGMKSFINAFSPKNIFTTLRLTDWIFIFLVIVFIFSYIFSDFKKEAWSGSAGRYQGLECWLYYFVSYLLVTRTFKFKPFYLDWAILAGVFACQWGILDFYFLDPFGFLQNVSDLQKLMFASSVGNYNTYTNYVTMTVALVATLFCNERKIWKTIIYAVLLMIALDGSVTGLSDNATLGMIAFLGILPFYCLKDRRGLGRYFIIIAELLICISFTQISRSFPGVSNHFSAVGSIYRTICDISSIHYITAITVVFAILINLFLYFQGKNYLTLNDIKDGKNVFDLALPKCFIYIWLGIFIATLLGVTFVILDVNVWHNFPQLRNTPFSNFLIFDDNWGTHRGHNWRIALQAFSNFSPIHKLFGHGPDTYLIVTETTAYEEMVNNYGEVYDSAHNEYIHYLICEGALGLLSYLAFFTSGIVRAFKNALDNPYVMACIFAVLSYLIQAVVNIAIPITTPVFFTLFFIAIAYMNEIEIEQIKSKNLEA